MSSYESCESRRGHCLGNSQSTRNAQGTCAETPLYGRREWLQRALGRRHAAQTGGDEHVDSGRGDPFRYAGQLRHNLRQSCRELLGIASWTAPVILGTRSPAIIARLIAKLTIRRVNFTGSTHVGRIIGELPARHLTPALPELDSKAPLLHSRIPSHKLGSSRFSSPTFLCSCVILGLALAGPVEAHVKWFAQWDIICPPRDPMRVLASDLWRVFFAATVVVMATLAALDWHLARGSAMDRLSQCVHDAVVPWSMSLLRCGMAIYWVLAATCLPHSVYLTPELWAPHWVMALQLAAAALVLWRPTAWLAGLALIGLYAMAVVDHGWFHLLDYPLFLGLAIILLLPKLAQGVSPLLCLDILRASAAVTLLWGGIEKFAYPEWSFSLMENTPFLSLGVSPETAMYMYGFGEVALSFGLLAFGIGSQVAAALLLLVFVAAIPPFGIVDLVGHSGIIAGLVLLTLTRSRLQVRLPSAVHNASWHGAAFSATLAALGIGYFGLHGLHISL